MVEKVCKYLRCAKLYTKRIFTSKLTQKADKGRGLLTEIWRDPGQMNGNGCHGKNWPLGEEIGWKFYAKNAKRRGEGEWNCLLS